MFYLDLLQYPRCCQCSVSLLLYHINASNWIRAPLVFFIIKQDINCIFAHKHNQLVCNRSVVFHLITCVYYGLSTRCCQSPATWQDQSIIFWWKLDWNRELWELSGLNRNVSTNEGSWTEQFLVRERKVCEEYHLVCNVDSQGRVIMDILWLTQHTRYRTLSCLHVPHDPKYNPYLHRPNKEWLLSWSCMHTCTSVYTPLYPWIFPVISSFELSELS